MVPTCGLESAGQRQWSQKGNAARAPPPRLPASSGRACGHEVIPRRARYKTQPSAGLLPWGHKKRSNHSSAQSLALLALLVTYAPPAVAPASPPFFGPLGGAAPFTPPGPDPQAQADSTPATEICQ